METAISIYLGKREIRADSDELNSLSYKNLGLRCPYCGEPVLYRCGDLNKPHFAHFPSIDPQKYEECIIRRKNDENGPSFSHPWWERSGKKQRLYLFQEHFIYIIKTSIPELDLTSLDIESQQTCLNDLQLRTIQYARDKLKDFQRYERIFGSKQTAVECEIVCEAFDYSTVSSSKNLFKALTDNILGRNQHIAFDEEDLCFFVLGALESVNWLEVFKMLAPPDDSEELTCLSGSHAFMKRLEGQPEEFIYLDKGSIWLFSEDSKHWFKAHVSRKGKEKRQNTSLRKFPIGSFLKTLKSFFDSSKPPHKVNRVEGNSGDAKALASSGSYLDTENIRLGRIDISKLSGAKWLARSTRKRVPVFNQENLVQFTMANESHRLSSENLNKVFGVSWSKSLKRYAEGGDDEKMSLMLDEDTILMSDRNNGSFVKTLEAHVFLSKKSSNEFLNVAKAEFNPVIFEERVCYEFNDFFVTSNAYDPAVLRKPSIAVAMNGLFREMYKALMD